jgi:protein involved in plasmid replication-relaxation
MRTRTYLPQSRRLADKKPPFVPQARDFEILTAVYDNRFLTTSMLAQLFPPDHSRKPTEALRATGRELAAPSTYPRNLVARLGKLFHHRHLDRLRSSYGGEIIYALGQHGAELIRDRQLRLFSDKIDWAEKNRGLAQGNIDHALTVSRFRTALTVALRSTPTITLDRFEREGQHLKAEWRRAGRRAYVYPDAFFALRDSSRPEGKDRAHFFLEADRSTMKHSVMGEKFERYSELYREREHTKHYGISSFRVLTVTKSADRARHLANTLRDGCDVPEAHRPFFLFLSETDYAATPANLLATVWRGGDQPENGDLRALIGSPLPRT